MKDRTGDGVRGFGEEGFQDDWFVAGLEYDAGREGWAEQGGCVRLESGLLKMGVPVRFEVQGERGSWVKAGMDQQEDHLRAGKVPGDEGFGADPVELEGKLIRPGERERTYAAGEFGGYIKVYENLRDVIRNGGELITPPMQAAEAVRIVELLGRSSNERRTLSAAL